MNNSNNIQGFWNYHTYEARKMGKKDASKYITSIIPKALIKYIKTIKSEERVLHFLKLGFKIDYVPMGSGGVGQIKTLWTKREARIQLTYGQGMGNYANAIIIKY